MPVLATLAERQDNLRGIAQKDARLKTKKKNSSIVYATAKQLAPLAE